MCSYSSREMDMRFMGKKASGSCWMGCRSGSRTHLEVVAKRIISPPAKNRIPVVSNLTTGFIDGAGMFHLGRSEMRGSRRPLREMSFVLWAEYVIVVPHVMVAIPLTRRFLKRKVNLSLGFRSSGV